MRPEQYADHAAYLSSLHEVVMRQLGALVDGAVERARQSEPGSQRRDARRQLYEEAWAHCAQCAHLAAGPAHAFTQHGRQLLRRGAVEEHQAVLLYGPPGSGKSTLLAHLCRVAPDVLGRDTILIVRHVGLTPRSCAARDIIQDVCAQVNQALGRPTTDTAPYDMPRLLGHYYAMLNSVAKGSRQLVIAIDGIDQLKYSQQPPSHVQVSAVVETESRGHAMCNY